MPITPRPEPRTQTPALPRADLMILRTRIHPGVVASFYGAVSRDVSAGAPKAPRIETRDANESDFTPDGVAEPGTQVEMPQWHRGVTN